MKYKLNGQWVDLMGFKGSDGKSAYASAVDGGYTGTEAEFYQVLGDAATNEYVDGEISDLKDEVEEELEDLEDKFDTVNNVTDSKLSNNPFSVSVAKYPLKYTYDVWLRYKDTEVSGENKSIAQAICTDGKRYLWFICNHADTSNTGIVKYDVVENKVVKQVFNHSYRHANGMCYCEDTNQLYLLSWSKNDATTRSDVSIVDADTLDFVELFQLPDMTTTIHTNYAGISNVCYDNSRKCFVYSLNPFDVDGVSKRGLMILDRNNNYVKHKLINVGSTNTTAGMTCTDSLIAWFEGNRLAYYDWDLNKIGVMSAKFLYDLSVVYEVEGLAVCNGITYVAANNKTDGTNVYGDTTSFVNILKCKESVMKYLNIKELLALLP